MICRSNESWFLLNSNPLRHVLFEGRVMMCGVDNLYKCQWSAWNFNFIILRGWIRNSCIVIIIIIINLRGPYLYCIDTGRPLRRGRMTFVCYEDDNNTRIITCHILRAGHAHCPPAPSILFAYPLNIVLSAKLGLASHYSSLLSR